MNQGIAIVGMACRYPDAASPSELWETVLAGRRAFRAVPPERLRLADYRESAPGDPDSIYLREAALLADWEFDRARFRVAGATFRAADPAHWLALEVAADALAAAGFADGAGLPRDTTGVLLGNTLTGELSRAQTLRLRWPYVRRVAAGSLAALGWDEDRTQELLGRLERDYKAPFAEPMEETLAGGLSNTIAGRICNHFDLHGGGYTLDGACASSLLAVAQACSALAAGDLDLALAGGVDLSIDPFELVGFARAGALARGEMLVFDARSSGFLPGEGCGFVVLMREADARAAGRNVHAVIRGWGISSDGHGGISRPEAAGQRRALARAYRRAGFGIDTVAYFEGHGTGTSVGDATELAALSGALREARAGAGGGSGGSGGSGAIGGSGARLAALETPAAPWTPATRCAAAIGSIKANIGHTKAAAGLAGLLKATLALEHQILPPTTGCEEPHAELAAAGAPLRALAAAEVWPAGRPLRAAVSAMGFGGVNAHVVLEGPAWNGMSGARASQRHLLSPPQDAELFLLVAPTAAELAARASQLAATAARLSHAELGDLAAELWRRLDPRQTSGGTTKPVGAEAIIAAPAVPAATNGANAPVPAASDAAAEPNGSGSGLARAAVVAGSPVELAERLALLTAFLEQDPAPAARLDPRHGVCLAVRRPGEAAPRIGLLFTGQGSPVYHPHAGNGRPAGLLGGALRRRFAELAPVYEAGGAGGTGAGDLARAAAAADGGGGTAVAQPAILAHCFAGLWLLERLGVAGEVAVGHSLGEIAALAWAGGCDADAAVALGAVRGRAMDDCGAPGAMASLGAGPEEVSEILGGAGATLAAFNGPARTVVSGPPSAVEAVVARAAARGWATNRLKVERAFHSPGVAAAAADLAPALAAISWRPLTRAVASTVSGALLPADADLPALLLQQVTAPVRFTDAMRAAAPLADLWIEVGPGHALADLAAELLGRPVLALDAGGPSLAPALGAAAALFAAGVPFDPSCFFEGRFHRPFDLDRPPRFLANPCESVPVLAERPAGNRAAAPLQHPAGAAMQRPAGADMPHLAGAAVPPPAGVAVQRPAGADVPLPAGVAQPYPGGVTGQYPGTVALPHAGGVAMPDASATSVPDAAAGAAPSATRQAPPPAPQAIDVVRSLVAARAELPASLVKDDSRLLSDLHLNSITIGQLVVEASRQLGLTPPASPTDYAQTTVGEMAQALAGRAQIDLAGGDAAAADTAPAGVDTWVRPFTVELVERPLPVARHAVGALSAAAPDTRAAAAKSAAPAGTAQGTPAARRMHLRAALEETEATGTAAPGTTTPATAERPRWQRFAPDDHPLAEAVAAALDAAAPAAEAAGILLCLPAALDEDSAGLLGLCVAAAHAAAELAGAGRFVVVQHGGGGGGLARTLRLELPAVATWVIDLPAGADPAAAAAWVRAEVLARPAPGGGGNAGGYVEAHYDAAGVRRVPVLRQLAVSPAGGAPGGLGAEDVLLVSGGGKGIGAECAMALAQATGARLAIVGRSDPLRDPELARNLERLAAAAGRPPLYRRGPPWPAWPPSWGRSPPCCTRPVPTCRGGWVRSTRRG
jgi:enediyne polyketide synthase